MQFQVPQFIETEDKIVGPLSLRQFIVVGAGVGVCALLYFILQTWIWVFLAIIIMAITISLSFLKIQGRPFARVILSAFNFYWNPQTYIWQPEHATLPKREREEEPKKTVVHKPTAPTARARVAEGTALRKSWQTVQTGEKISAKQFTEQKMYGRYQIFQKITGDRNAARRVDYR
jgi:hypothetical protein